MIETPLERIISSIQKKKQCPVVRSFERKTILVIRPGLSIQKELYTAAQIAVLVQNKHSSFQIQTAATYVHSKKKSVFKIDVRKLAYFGKKRVQIVAHGLSELSFV